MVDPYASKVLSKDHHERLVADLDQFACDANIQPHWIYTALPKELSPDVRKYLVNYRKLSAAGALAGMCFTRKGLHGLSSDVVMSALAGCLVRNFIRARVMTMTNVVQAIADKNPPKVSCLLIPNFFYSSSEGGALASWQVSAVYDLLIARRVAGHQTLIYVSDMAMLGKEYGLAMQELVSTHFQIIGG